MKISTKGRYGLRILLDLAVVPSGELRMIRQIAESQQISEKYTSRLIIALRKAGLVDSVRGVQGGYKLAKKPELITILEIIEIMEGSICVADCVDPQCHCGRKAECPTRPLWEELNQLIRSCFEKYTLLDLVNYTKGVSLCSLEAPKQSE